MSAVLSIRIRRVAGEMKRRWERIGYYSARKRAKGWTRAYHIALVASLFLAFPVVLMTEWLYDRDAETERTDGRLLTMPEGDVQALVVAPEESPPWPAGNPWGEFSLVRVERWRGWPFGSSVHRPPVRLDLNRFDTTGIQRDVQLRPDEPMRLAIERALDENGIDASLAGANATATSGRSVAGTVANSFIVFTLLALVAALVTSAGDLHQRLRKDKARLVSRERRRSNKCAKCGYDLTGLDFHGRCPECGSLLL